jgi:hypothetical protein
MSDFHFAVVIIPLLQIEAISLCRLSLDEGPPPAWSSSVRSKSITGDTQSLNGYMLNIFLRLLGKTRTKFPTPFLLLESGLGFKVKICI